MTGRERPETLSEYRRRFKGLHVWRLRRRMRPELLAVFLRFAGCIEGPPDFDVVAACDEMWEVS